MTPIQKIQIRMSETREKLNDLVAGESADDITQRDKLSADLKSHGNRVESGYRTGRRGQHFA